MSTVYKKLTAQDIAVVPFNAHKQYTFTSGSAASNKVTHFSSRWTSESIDIYSGNSGSDDGINSIKYRQLDHLFYQNFKRDISNRFGNNHYLNQKRELHETANILSIPTGLYGFEIKPGSFYVSSSNTDVIDDLNGNLIISGTDLSNYEIDIRSNILNIGPIKGFKKYDLNTTNGYISFDGYTNSIYYRDGKLRPNKILSYNTPSFGDEFDDSYYFNLLRYRYVNFSKQVLFENHFPCIHFNGSTSELRLGHNVKFNFNKGDDFTINLWANVSQSSTATSYLISKSTTRTTIQQQNTPIGTPVNLTNSGSSQPQDISSRPQFPFEVYVKSSNKIPCIFFSKSDGDNVTTISASFTTQSMQHITCRTLATEMKIYINGIASGTTSIEKSFKQTQNQANIYIGNKGGNTNHLSGSISQINIFDKGLTDIQILNHYSSSNGNPYIGNIFYQSGMVTVTHPNHQLVLSRQGVGGVGAMEIGNTFVVDSGADDKGINRLKFQGTHLIYENEYQCTIDENEFNNTSNISARKFKTSQTEDVADFTTSSLFSPYVTTIGLYNEDNDLLVVGKLGQPIRMSDETDTTFVLRWDT